MTTAIEITQLPPDQWPAYREIRLEMLQTEPRAYGSTYAETCQRPDSFWQQRMAAAQGPLDSRTNWLLFARAGGQIVGTIGAYRHDTSPGEDGAGDADAAEIVGVYVTPAARGRGVAAALLAALIQEMLDGGQVRRLTLGVNARQEAALALYRRFGFTIYETIERRLGDGQLYAFHVMEKELRP